MAMNRDPQREPQRGRRSSNNGPTHRFHFDPSVIPDGMDYNWKRLTCKGETDTEHQIECAENGWTPVPAERHPDKAGRDAKPGSMIVRGGLVAMERPKQLSKEAVEEDTREAHNQLATQFKRLGQSKEGAMPRTKPKARRSWTAASDFQDDAS